MKIEKINFNKLKVTFSPEDLIEHNITPEAIKNNSPVIQRVLMMVMHRAEDEFEFSAENARLMVEALPGENDSMVMYITKLESDDELKDTMRSIKKKLRLRVRPAQYIAEKNICVTFSDFEDAVRLAIFLREETGGTLYHYDGHYHLIAPVGFSPLAAEFGKITAEENACRMVAEHGKKICDNALKTLRAHFA